MGVAARARLHPQATVALPVLLLPVLLVHGLAAHCSAAKGGYPDICGGLALLFDNRRSC
jgi:hypothetical protein